MKTLGISMIVKNESQIIENCLNSIKDADEIVIVDTGSKDNTIELCKKYTNKVYFDRWIDNFAHSRNISLSHCTSDYVLIIDADETLETPISQLKKIINEPWFEKYAGMIFEVETKPETFESPRILKRCPEIYYINAIHNIPSWNGDPPELQKRMYRSSFKIKSGYSPAHNLDPDRTLRILLKELNKDRKNTRNRYYLGKEYINKNQIKKAVEQFEIYRKEVYFDVSKWNNELADVLYLLSLSYADEETYKNRWHDAVRSALESWAVLPTSKNTAGHLKNLFGEMPGSTKEQVRVCKLSYDFFAMLEKNAPDTGVMMKRNYDEEIS
jgi:glycosyltransferase involved in cell wall biosynthesis